MSVLSGQRRFLVWTCLTAVVLLLLLAGARWKKIPKMPTADEDPSARLMTAFQNRTSFGEVLKLLPTTDIPREVVDRLTTPPGYEIADTGGRLVFAHIADGAMGQSRAMRTAFTLTNDSVYPVTGVLEFFDDKGSALSLTIDGRAVSRLAVTVEAGTTRKIRTAGTGAVKSGWAILTTDQPLAGTSSFFVSDSAGTVFTDVGVEESLLKTEFTLFADTKGSANTGIALINPSTQMTLNLTLELCNPNGTLKKSRTLSLGPRNHLAQFLDELFKGTAGIDEFEGTLLIKGDFAFGGVTLRSVGSLLTSVPMAAAPNPRLAGSQLEFPQVADGAEGSYKIITSVILINNTDQTVTGNLEFVQADGQPMVVSIANRAASSFPYSLPSKGSTRFVTQAKTKIKTGWARVSKDGPISGCAIYHILNQAGAPLTEVGVAAVPGATTINALVDSTGSYRTGLALANVDEEETEIEVSIDLYDAAGTKVGNRRVTLLKGTQQALFLDELFSDVANIQEFQGRAKLSCSDGFAALTLRQSGLLTTSVPTLLPLFGFAPTTVVSLGQNLTGSSPMLRLQMAQAGYDLSLGQLNVSVPSIGVNLAAVKPGDEIGYGYFLVDLLGNQTGGIAKLIATDSTGVNFDLVGSMQDTLGAVLMIGRINGQSSGGFVLKLAPPEAPNNLDNNNLVGFEIDLVLRDGLVQLPAAPGEIAVTSTHTSSSTKLNEENVSIVRTARQKLAIAAPVGGAPRLLSTRPILFSPGTQIAVTGSGFGASPRVFFTNENGGQTEAFFPLVDGSTLSVPVPSDARDGALVVRNGAVSSNPLGARTLFSQKSVLTVTAGATAGSFTVNLKSTIPARQLEMARTVLQLYQVAWPVVKADAEGMVGAITKKGGSTASSTDTFKLGVESSDSNRIRLFVRDDDDETVAHLDIDRVPGDVTPGVRFTYSLDEPLEVPQVNGFPVEIEWNLPGLTFARNPAGSTTYWSVELFSCPSDLFGSGTGLTALQELTKLN